MFAASGSAIAMAGLAEAAGTLLARSPPYDVIRGVFMAAQAVSFLCPLVAFLVTRVLLVIRIGSEKQMQRIYARRPVAFVTNHPFFGRPAVQQPRKAIRLPGTALYVHASVSPGIFGCLPNPAASPPLDFDLRQEAFQQRLFQ